MKTHELKILPQYLIKVKSSRTKEIYDLAILKEKEKDEYRICNITKGIICSCIFNSGQEAIADIKKYEKNGKNTILGLKQEGIILKNINLTGISLIEQMDKVKEEEKEFMIAIELHDKENAIEEFFDCIQSKLGLLEKEFGISASEVMKEYDKHISKIANRPRKKE